MHKLFIPALVLFAAVFMPDKLFALSSTNYEIAGHLTAGSGAGSSTNYQQKGSVEGFAGSSLTSTNYQAKSGSGSLALFAPVIEAVTPGDLTRIFSDESFNFTVTATDPDSQTLQYSAYQDATQKVAPQSSSNLTWNVSAVDLGRREISIEVYNGTQTVHQDISAYVYRRPMK